MKKISFNSWCKQVEEVHQEHVQQLIKMKNKNLTKQQKKDLKKAMKLTSKKEHELEKAKIAR